MLGRTVLSLNLFHSSSTSLRPMRSCQTQRKGTCMTREENKLSKREDRVEDLLQWTSSTCSLEVEEGCREREKVRCDFCWCKRLFCASQRAFSNLSSVSGFSVGKNVVHQLSVSLEEMYKGSTRRLGLQKNVICEKCEGMFIFGFIQLIKILSLIH